MTPREFAEHVERESDRIGDALLDEAIKLQAADSRISAIERQLDILNRLARQHAIDQEQDNG